MPQAHHIVDGATASLRRMLPPAMVQLHEQLGDDALLRLVAAYGGTRLYIPDRLMPGMELAKCLTAGDVAALVKHRGSGWTEIAACKTWRIHLLRHRGLTHEAIALSVGVSRKTVIREMDRDRTGRISYGAGLANRQQLGFKFD